MRLLSKASGDLLGALDKSVSHLVAVIHRFKSLDNTWRALVRYDADEVEKLVKASRARLDELKSALILYRDDKRLEVVRPFARLFDPFGAEVRGEVGDDEMKSQPSHRGLFWAFQYEHALLGWGEALVDLFETVLKVETKRRRPKCVFSPSSLSSLALVLTPRSSRLQDLVAQLAQSPVHACDRDRRLRRGRECRSRPSFSASLS